MFGRKGREMLYSIARQGTAQLILSCNVQEKLRYGEKDKQQERRGQNVAEESRLSLLVSRHFYGRVLLSF